MAPDRLADVLALVPERQMALDEWVWQGGTVVTRAGCAAAVRRSDLHPHRTWLAVAPGHATAGSVHELIRAARAEAGQTLRIRTWDGGAAASILELGGRLLVESHAVTVATVPTKPRWGRSAVVEREVTDPAVIDAMWALYRRIHAWDPIVEGALPPGRLGADVIVAGLVEMDGRVVGVAAAHEGEPAEAALVGFLEPVTDETRATLELVRWLVGRCGTLEIEADDGVGAHPCLVGALRLIPEARWAEPLPILELD